MINKRTIFEIHRLQDQGLSVRRIARQLGLSRPTVTKYLQQPDITKSEPKPRPKKLDPYGDYINELLSGWPDVSAVVIKQRLDDKGYTGGISILRDYLRYNFWPCRTFNDLDDVNAQAVAWRDQIANQRVQETTAEIPQQRFRAEALRTLPDTLPDTRDTAAARVHNDCRFKFDANSYSAPHWMVGKTLTIKADNHTVTASYNHKIITKHRRSWQRKAVIENPNHVQDLLRTRKKARYTKQQQLFLSMGEDAKRFLECLAQVGKNLSHAMTRLLELRDQYGTPAVVAAIQIAMKYQAYGVDYVENILYQQMRPINNYAPINLRDATLNELRLQEPDLLLYDAIALKKRRDNRD